MEVLSQAKIINYNMDNEAVCASAARISTTKGNAFTIFEKAKENPNNQDLIQKVLRSGHKSFIEHVSFTIALCNVSAFVEQFFIESRLASFTIKSRRYVDFSEQGYYIPSELTGDSRLQYCNYMDMLFEAYQKLIGEGIPKEDARFLLPYSFHSNFYCTVNARELSYIIRTIYAGRGRGIPELKALADQIVNQIQELFPCLLPEFACASGDEGPVMDSDIDHGELTFMEGPEIGGVSLLDFPANPLKKLNMAYQISHPASGAQPFDISALLRSDRPRELEQLSYTFFISNITLSGITHIVRHRMQSILIPSIQNMNFNKYIIPASVKDNALLFYKQTLEAANAALKQMSGDAQLEKYRYYFALSGNVMDIMTTVNARELRWFIKLRACSRAQWEIRDISIRMLGLLREHCPEIFRLYGPSCFTEGYCPEGRLSCGEMQKVIAEFGR